MMSAEEGISSDVTKPTPPQAKGYGPFTSSPSRDDDGTGSYPLSGEDDETDNLL